MSTDLLQTKEQLMMHKKEWDILSKHSQDYKGKPLVDHVSGPDGKEKNSPVLDMRVRLAANDFITEFGALKPTRGLIRIRVAGSALVGHCLGRSIDWIRVWMHQEEHVGCAQFDPVEPTDNMGSMLFSEAAVVIGGFGTARSLGTTHPSQCVRAKVEAAAICRYMEVSLGKPEFHFFKRTLDYAKEVVTTNRETLNTLISGLSPNGFLSREEAASILKNCRPISVDPFLYG